MNIKELQKAIHENAVNHGWWETERPVPEILCLIHSEVSEAFEAYINNDDDNLAEELSDIAIRLLDAAEGYNIDLVDTEWRMDSLYDTIPIALCAINLDISKALEAFRNHNKDSFARKFRRILSTLLGVAQKHNINLEAEIIKKHEHNKTRSYRHGGKAA